MTAAEHDDAVAQLEQHVEVLADIDDGDAVHLLLGQQIVDGVGCVDVQAAHGVGRHQHGGGLGDLASDEHLLHVAARHTADGERRAGRHDAELFPDAVGERFGVLAVDEHALALAPGAEHHVARHAHRADKTHAESVFGNERHGNAALADLHRVKADELLFRAAVGRVECDMTRGDGVETRDGLELQTDMQAVYDKEK